MIPNLFLVGEPKSGTTALYNFLAQHPAVFMPINKENSFFCDDMRSEAYNRPNSSKEKPPIHDIDSYLGQYADFCEGIKYAGDGSTNNLYSKTAARRIYELNPEAKIIAMFREPVAFLHSYQQYQVFRLIEEDIPLDASLALEADRKKGKRIPDILAVPSMLFYSERVKYSEHLQRYLDVFPKEQILVLLYDDFISDNQHVYFKVLDFLGVSRECLPAYRKYNVSKQIKSRTLSRLIYLSSISDLIKQKMPVLYPFAQYLYNVFLTRKQKKKELDPEFKLVLKHRFKPEVQKLNDLLVTNQLMDIGSDLMKRWGYEHV